MKVFLITIAALALFGSAYIMWFLPETEREPATVLKEETLICEDETQFDVSFLSDDNIIVELNNVPYELSPAVAASGARWANTDESFVFWNKGDESMIVVSGEVTYQTCMTDEARKAREAHPPELIVVTSPEENATVTTPIILSGEARGYWFFEASAPVLLQDTEGNVLAEWYIEATGEWMTEDMVPFEGELSFELPEGVTKGVVVFKKANMSDLPEHDASVEIPVRFVE